jgi:TolB-like protein/DNA-binding winged helix-turn-helix (wHTH) protein/Tfp pilus assembly protein PilF
MTRPATQLYEFGPFRLDPVRRVLLREGEIVPLTPKAFDTLLALIENSDRVIEKDELMKTLWPDTIVEERNLAVNISSLRKALGETATDHRYIVTVPGRGYRFAANVRRLRDESGDLIVEHHSRSRVFIHEQEGAIRGNQEDSADMLTRGQDELAASARHRVAAPPFKVLAILLLLAGAAAALIYLVISGKSKQVDRNPAASVPAATSIAVLPFKQLGVEAGDEYFGLGVADVLITRLSNIRQITIRPTSAVLKYSGQAQDPAAAGRELGVDSVLEGNVQRAGEQIRVTVRLVSVRDGAPLWAEKFDAKFTDIFKVQDSISEQVARALMLKLTGEEQVRLTRRYTDNTEAYQAYLRGRYFWNKRTEKSFENGIKYFRQAIELDPNYALAYAGLADSYLLLGSYSFQPPTDAMLKARTAALKALEIDDTLAEAHTSLAVVKYRYDWDWSGAEREFKQAIELNLNYPTAHYWYAHFLVQMERFDEAMAEAKQALALDPLSLITNHIVGLIFYYVRQYDQAIEQYRKTLDLDPNFDAARLFLGRAYVQKGMYTEAIAELQKAIGLNEDNLRITAALGHAYAVSGRGGEAQKVLNKLKELSKRRYVPPFDVALIYAGLGEKDEAFAWLEKAYEERAVRRFLFLKIEPAFDGLRSDSRFQDLLRRMGFEQ